MKSPKSIFTVLAMAIAFLSTTASNAERLENSHRAELAQVSKRTERLTDGAARNQRTISADETAEPRWPPTNIPILPGSVADNPAKYQKSDLNEIPSFNGYELIPLGPIVCATRLKFLIKDRDGKGLEEQSASLDKATQFFGYYLSDSARCPLLEILTFGCKPVCNGRSAFSVERRYDWRTNHFWYLQKKEREAHRQKTVQVYQQRSLPTESTHNPLGHRGYFASSLVAQFGSITLYEAYYTERKFYRQGAVFVMVHDIEPEAPLVRVIYDSFHKIYQTAQNYAEMVDISVEYPSYRSTSPQNVLHYVKDHTSNSKMINSSETQHIEAPLLTSYGRKFNLPYSPNYSHESVYYSDLVISLSDLTGAK